VGENTLALGVLVYSTPEEVTENPVKPHPNHSQPRIQSTLILKNSDINDDDDDDDDDDDATRPPHVFHDFLYLWLPSDPRFLQGMGGAGGAPGAGGAGANPMAAMMNDPAAMQVGCHGGGVFCFGLRDGPPFLGIYLPGISMNNRELLIFMGIYMNLYDLFTRNSE